MNQPPSNKAIIKMHFERKKSIQCVVKQENTKVNYRNQIIFYTTLKLKILVKHITQHKRIC